LRSPDVQLLALDPEAQDVTGAGTAKFRSAEGEWQLTTDYKLSAGRLEVVLRSTPVAVAYRNESALGGAPTLLLDGVHAVQVELRSAERAAPLLVMLNFVKAGSN